MVDKINEAEYKNPLVFHTDGKELLEDENFIKNF